MESKDSARLGHLVKGSAIRTNEDLDWQLNALCAQTDPEQFFPEAGGSARAALAVCLRCEVRRECLAFALEHDERFGVWGGLTERSRRRLRREAARSVVRELTSGVDALTAFGGEAA